MFRAQHGVREARVSSTDGSTGHSLKGPVESKLRLEAILKGQVGSKLRLDGILKGQVGSKLRLEGTWTAFKCVLEATCRPYRAQFGSPSANSTAVSPASSEASAEHIV